MRPLEQEIRRVVNELELDITLLDSDAGRELRLRVEQAYAPSRCRWPLWESFRFPAAIQGQTGWHRIVEFVGNNECFLLLNPQDAPTVFRCASGSALDELLQETYGFELYVTDQAASYLLCFNHHDMLLGAGRAEAWLSEQA